MEDILVQFNIYDENTSVVNVSNLFDKLKNLYDDAIMSYDNYNHIKMTREFSDLSKNEGVWQYSVQYRVNMEEK